MTIASHHWMPNTGFVDECQKMMSHKGRPLSCKGWGETENYRKKLEDEYRDGSIKYA